MSNVQNYLLAVPRISYLIALLDFGPKLGIGPSASSGTPEATRSDIIDEVREHIQSGGCVVHVRQIDGSDMLDVTHEIIEAALARIETEPSIFSQADVWDHAHDLRKHSQAAE